MVCGLGRAAELLWAGHCPVSGKHRGKVCLSRALRWGLVLLLWPPPAGLGWGLRLNHLDFLWELQSVGLAGSGEVGGCRQSSLAHRAVSVHPGLAAKAVRGEDEGWLGMEEPSPCLTWELLQGFG